MFCKCCHVTFWFEKVLKNDLLNAPIIFNLLPETFLDIKDPSFSASWNVVHTKKKYHTDYKIQYIFFSAQIIQQVDLVLINNQLKFIFLRRYLLDGWDTNLNNNWKFFILKIGYFFDIWKYYIYRHETSSNYLEYWFWDTFIHTKHHEKFRAIHRHFNFSNCLSIDLVYVWYNLEFS